MLEVRSAAAETSSDGDCLPPTYEECLTAQQHLARSDARLSTQIEVITEVCTGSDEDKNLGLSCFNGCSIGSTSGVPAQYHFLRAGADGTWMTHRCADNLLHPSCLCAAPPPPPPPQPAQSDGPVWAGRSERASLTGQPTGYYEEAIGGSTLPATWAAGTSDYDCVGEDNGAAQCTRFCAQELGLHAKAFTVRGQLRPPSPPPPPPPPAPPFEPQSPSAPNAVFNGASEGCVTSGTVGLSYDVCRDSGPGSTAPPVCDYGSQVRLCGHRPDVRDKDLIIGNNDCAFANDGVCQDGGDYSEFVLDADGQKVSLCKYGTDMNDCPLRRAVYGPNSYGTAPKPPYPPPPPSPAPPPGTGAPAEFLPCADTCSNYRTQDGTDVRVADAAAPQICSDGGLGARPVPDTGGFAFACPYGTQVRTPSPPPARRPLLTLCPFAVHRLRRAPLRHDHRRRRGREGAGRDLQRRLRRAVRLAGGALRYGRH
jgi:hypothetical protein